MNRGKNVLERVPQRRFSAHTNYQAPRSADDKRLVNDRTRDEAQDQNALVSDGFVGDGDAHEASIATSATNGWCLPSLRLG